MWGACALKGPGDYGGVARVTGLLWFWGFMPLVMGSSGQVFATIKFVQVIMTGHSYVTGEVITISINV